jgi:hypothetical protein
MAAAAPAILDDVFDLARWLKNVRDYNDLLELLKGDRAAVLVVNSLCEMSSSERTPEFVAGAVALLHGLFQMTPPQLHRTYSYVRNVLTTLKIGLQPLESGLEVGRGAALQRRSMISDSVEMSDAPPTDWIGP